MDLNLIPRRALEGKKFFAALSFDFDNFDEKNFYNLDQFVNEYHVISLKTKEQLKKLTDKK